MNTWIKIKGFPLYEVNEDGQVRSWRKKKRILRNPEENPGEIRSRYIPRQVTQYQLAEDYKVAVSTINHIVNRKKWVYLE